MVARMIAGAGVRSVLYLQNGDGEEIHERVSGFREGGGGGGGHAHLRGWNPGSKPFPRRRSPRMGWLNKSGRLTRLSPATTSLRFQRC